MEEYYSWAKHNNMSYNNSKFVTLRYGKNDTLKQDTMYFSDDMLMPIEEYDNHKDLGVIMDSDGTFNTHINTLIKKLRKKI